MRRPQPIVGHLAWQEQRYLLWRPQKVMLRNDIQTRFTTGGKMTTPFLDVLTMPRLRRDLPLPSGKRSGQTPGDAIRQMLKPKKKLPEYVGSLEAQAPYRPERA